MVSPDRQATPLSKQVRRQLAFFGCEVLTDVTLQCPTKSQGELIAFAHQDYLRSREGYAGERVDSHINERQGLFDRLAQETSSCSVRWLKHGPQIHTSQKLCLTSGLPRGLLCLVENYDSNATTIKVHQNGFLEGTTSEYTILPGHRQPVFLQVQADAVTTSSIELVFQPNEEETSFNLSLPVEVVEPAVLRGRIVEELGKKTVPARVFALGSDGQYRRGVKYAHNETLSQKQLLQFWELGKFYQLPFFYSDGTFELVMPPGKVELTVERGFEHESTTTVMHLQPGEVKEITCSTKRFCDMAERGWVSGDTHVHWVINRWDVDLPLELLSVVQRAEDLRVANNLTLLQRGPSKAFINPQQSMMGAVEAYCDQDYHIEMGEEYRNEDLYGHLCFLNLDWLVMPIGTGSIIAGPDALDYPINKTAILACREQGGISIEAHGLGGNKDVPVNVIHGLTDSLDQIEPDEYYRFLDCGFKLPLTNGSDHPARVLGCARAYVKVDGDFTYDKWIEGIRQGKTFTTSGPLISLAVNEAEIGDTLDVGRDDVLHVEVNVESRHPVEVVEIVSNGVVVGRKVINDRTGTLNVVMPASESRWVVARCGPEGEFNAIRGPGVAHTSAVYVSVDGKPRVDPEAAKVWINRMHRHVHDIRTKGRFAADYQMEEAIEYVEQGIAKYESLVNAVASEGDASEPSQPDQPSASGAIQSDDQAESLEQRDAPVWPMVQQVERQPLLLQIDRLGEALEYIGNPLSESAKQRLAALRDQPDEAKVAAEVQDILDPLCVAGVRVSGDAISAAAASKQWSLVQKGWRSYLVKVCNDGELTTRLHVESPNARSLPHAKAKDVPSRWMGLSMFDGRPLQASLSGLKLEYRIVQIYSRDVGEKEAILEFSIDAKPGSHGRTIREWRFGEGADGWKALNQVEIEVEDGALQVNGKGEDPFIGTDIGGVSGDLLLRFWGEASHDGVGQVFFWTEEQPEPDPNKVATFALTPGVGRQYEAAIKVEGVLAGVRIDPNVKASEMRIDWIDLTYAHQRGETWTSAAVQFEAKPAVPVTVRVKDKFPGSAMAAFEIRDNLGRLYPEQSKRLAPDLFFQPQIYRGDGETIDLPPGEYTVRCWRGPESIPETKRLVVEKDPTELTYEVRRWIDASDFGWWSGDHHIHAAGCLHYQNPTQGIRPEHMIRQIMGEDLHVGCCLTWGPCFDYQKRFFTGADQDMTVYPYVVRYDVEVSGFGSHASGHLNLLRLSEQIYPGGDSKDHWPTLGLNTLKWAKQQGAICGPAHSAAGLTRYIDKLPIEAGPKGLPHYNIPAFDSIGANEFIMDVTHMVPGPDGTPVPAVDFIATMNTPRNDEWNIWYHTLNCGFRVRASGETDFPCMSGERVGIGRVYTKVDGPLNFPDWVQGIQDGRSYVSDAKVHLMDLRCQAEDGSTVELGVNGSELKMDEAQSLSFTATCAALLDTTDYGAGDAPKVEVELIVNGYPLASKEIAADGTPRDVKFEAEIDKSSWVALRVHPHAHTNPIFVIVEGQPVRASKASAEWCLRGVRQCWRAKQLTYSVEEQQDAREAFQHAENVFRQIKEECPE
ncbi:CehA/McbA family metallohydrolase [Aeoliella sp.]|uniref:CehA/McbA family metallohydrolase n=1 Tax=Aeoliella sp. TaxID=2795800 RepID=UPI003CCC30EA